MPWLRRTIGIATVLWSVALPVAALAVARAPAASTSYPFAFVVYAIGAAVCHQRPDRSFHLWTVALPVCARCAGIYVGAAVAYLASALRPIRHLAYEVSGFSRTRPLPYVVSGVSRTVSVDWKIACLLLAAALPTIATLAYEWFSGAPAGNWTRAAAGLPLGSAAIVLIVGLLD